MMNKLLFNNKTENGGLNAQGRLTATEFNALVDAINSHSDVFNDPSKSFAAPILLSDLDGVSLGLAPAIHLILDDSEEQPCAILFHLVRNDKQRAQVLLGNVEIGSDDTSLVSGSSPIILSRYIDDGELQPWSKIELIDTFYDILEEIRELQLNYNVDYRENQKQHSQFSALIEKLERQIATAVTEYAEPTMLSWPLGTITWDRKPLVTGSPIDDTYAALDRGSSMQVNRVRTAKLSSGDLKLTSLNIAATSEPIWANTIVLYATYEDNPISLSFDCAQIKTDHVLMDIVVTNGSNDPCVLKGFRPARVNEDATDADKNLRVEIDIPADLCTIPVYSVDIYFYTDDGSAREVGFANFQYTIGKRVNLAEEIRGLQSNKVDKTDLTKELEKKAGISDLSTLDATKADRSELSNVLARESSMEVEDVYRPEMKVFDDEWRAAGGTVIVSGETYGCNGIDDLTYEEAIVVLSFYRPKVKHPYQYSFARANTRTLLPINFVSQSDMTYCFQGADALISIHLTGENTKKEIRPSLAGWMFDGCKLLKNIYGFISLSMCTNVNLMFRDCVALENVNISELKISIGFPDSPLLSLASLQYLVINAANTSAVTVTVHPDVYAKLTDEANTEWNALLAQAAEKNITFATV